MLTLISGIIAALLMLFAISLLRVYRHVPAKELKRRARRGDDLARLFHQAVAYGVSLDILLWFVIGVSASVLFVMLSVNLAWPIALVLCMALVWFGFAWLPNAEISKYTVIAARAVTPVIHWLLEFLQPIFKRISTVVVWRLKHTTLHTGMYEKEDLIDLIENQKVQADNRITKEELQIAKHALQFGDKSVSEIMTPKRMIKTVSTVDMVGPVLMDKLHKSGHSRFPVQQNKEDQVIGTLYMRDVVNAKEGGFVKDIMRKDVFYVHEKQSLARVLDAFIKTKHHLFLVVNNFEEMVGLITIEDIVEQILGKQIIDEFDQYDNLRAVAGMHAEKDRENRTEVIESSEEEVKPEETSENPKQ